MESVGRAAARRWFSYTQKKTNSAKAKKLAGGETDRHKEPGRIFGEGQHEKRDSKCAILTSPCILCGNNEGN